MNDNASENKGELLLIKKIREGDEYAFEIAFLKYHAPLCRYVWKFVRSEELSKEIVQDLFTEIWESRQKLDATGHLRGFLFEVARNKALDLIQHQKIVNDYISEAKRQKVDSYNHNSARNGSYDQSIHKILQESIGDLPPRGRQILKLKTYEGLTYKEIAKYLDISVKTVETHMRRVLKKLRKKLQK